MTDLPLELEKSRERFDRREKRTVRDQGWGGTDQGLAVANLVVPKVSALVKVDLNDYNNNSPYERQLKLLLKSLDPDTVALCIVQTVFHAIAVGCPLRQLLLNVGRALSWECWAAGLTAHKPKLAKSIARYARIKHGANDQRRASAKAIGSAAGYKARQWGPELCLRAGDWGVDLLLSACPEMFVMETIRHEASGYFEYFLTITDAAWAVMDKAIAEAVLNNPVYQPMTEVPVDWVANTGGGYRDPRLGQLQFLRSRHKSVQAGLKEAISTGQAAPALKAVNSLQSVPWIINKPVLDVMRACWERGIEVKGLPRKTPLELPAKLPDDVWAAMDDKAKELWKYKRGSIKQANRQLKGELVGFHEDMATAERLRGDVFYTPMSCDWRGRVYGIPHFNFQRDDRVRALFLFANGAPIGERGLYWLKVHLANVGDFDKISKRPFEERVKWVDEKIPGLLKIAQDTLHELLWTQADKPFLFLAACMELRNAIAQGQNYVTRLPVAFDGSCSGLQHLSAMTRDEKTAALVNLLPTQIPQDVYQTVAESVRARLEVDASGASTTAHIARLCLDHGITRKLVKRNVMTFAYSSRKFGMTEQHMEDTMAPLKLEVLEGKRDKHPLSLPQEKNPEKEDQGFQAAKYLAGHIYEAIKSTVDKPAQAMTFLQKLAKLAAHESKVLRWTTPVGLPWENRYHELTTKVVRLWLNDKGVNIKVAVGDKKQIDKDRSANGVSPNFVHALDAAHLMLVVNAAASRGIVNLATVHDSFGCLASQAEEFRQIIGEEFVRMYQDHDPLAEVLAQAKCDLSLHNGDTLPPVPERGLLNLKDVLDAEYKFA